MIGLKIDNDFKQLIPPLTKEEYEQLEQNIIEEGCRDAIVLWQDTIIDGHNRYEICSKHNIQFKVTTKYFESREKVIEWMILNQFGRRNLSAYQRSILALRLKPIFEEKARERMLVGKELNPSQKSEQGKTSIELAKIARVSHDTISKVQKIEDKATPEQKQQLSTGQASINKIYTEIKKPKEDKKIDSVRESKKEITLDTFFSITELKKDVHTFLCKTNDVAFFCPDYMYLVSEEVRKIIIMQLQQVYSWCELTKNIFFKEGDII